MCEAHVKASFGTLGPHTRGSLLTGLPCTFTFHPVTEATTANSAPTSPSRFTEWTRTKMLREREREKLLPRVTQHTDQTANGSCPLWVCELQRTQPLPQGKAGVSELSWELGNLLSQQALCLPLSLTSRTLPVPCPMTGGKPHPVLSPFGGRAQL